MILINSYYHSLVNICTFYVYIGQGLLCLRNESSVAVKTFVKN